MTRQNPQRMECTEIWGGSERFEGVVALAGLNAWVYSKPCEQAPSGADVYYLSSCATGRVYRLLLADVSGHGAGASSAAANFRDLMRRYVTRLDQVEFVRELHHQLVAISKEGRFATAIVITFCTSTSLAWICNAGHPAPLLWRSVAREWRMLNPQPESPRRGSALPLGVMDVPAYAQSALQLDAEDLVLCYTDSLIEARDAGGRWLDQRGLLDVVRTLDASRPDALIPAMLDAIAGKAEGNLDRDDVTVVLFRPNGFAGRMALRDRLLAPFRVGRGLLGSI